MKFLFVSITFCLGIFHSYSQNVTLKLFIEDNAGNKDTITFGINSSSSLGLDSTLGELNIFGVALDSADVRVIQRDSINFNCIRETHTLSPVAPNLYFPENVDSKVDFRPFDSFQSLNNNFEIHISATEYPVYVTTDFSGISGSFLEWWSSIHLLNANCDAFDTKSISYDTFNDTLFILQDSTFTTLVANFQHEVSIKENDDLEPAWELFPNPANGIVTIAGLEDFNGKIETITILGQVVQKDEVIKDHEITIDLNGLGDGIYFIRFTSQADNETSISTLLKK